MPYKFSFVLDWLSEVCYRLYYLVLEGWLQILESGYYWYIICGA